MNVAFLPVFKRLAAPLAAMMVLAACNVTVEEGRPHHPPLRPNQPQMCTMEYAPVCGVRNNRQHTFANSCQARAEGHRIVHSGQCRTASTPPPSWNKPQIQPPHRPERPNRPHRPNGNWGNNNMSQTACTREYAPVCATNRGRNQSFSNACMARNAGFQVIRNGNCR